MAKKAAPKAMPPGSAKKSAPTKAATAKKGAPPIAKKTAAAKGSKAKNKPGNFGKSAVGKY